MRVGLKSGAPWKLTSACPKRLACGVGESSVTVCTQAGQPMPRLASLGAKFTPRSWARPASEASSSTNQTVWPPALPCYRLAAKRQSEALGPDPGRRRSSGVRDARGVVLVGRTLALFSAPWGYDPGLRCGILVQLLRREATHVYNRRPRRLRARGAHRRPHLRPLPRRRTRRHTRPVPGGRAPDR